MLSIKNYKHSSINYSFGEDFENGAKIDDEDTETIDEARDLDNDD